MEGRILKNEKIAWKLSGLGKLFIDFQFLWNIHQMVPRVAKVLIPHIDQLFKQGFVYYSCESLLCKKELRGKKRKKTRLLSVVCPVGVKRNNAMALNSLWVFIFKIESLLRQKEFIKIFSNLCGHRKPSWTFTLPNFHENFLIDDSMFSK